jgi:hypothetical protein
MGELIKSFGAKKWMKDDNEITILCSSWAPQRAGLTPSVCECLRVCVCVCVCRCQRVVGGRPAASSRSLVDLCVSLCGTACLMRMLIVVVVVGRSVFADWRRRASRRAGDNK